MGYKRIEWVDCAKGIGILLVIFAHSISNSDTLIGYLLLGAIFSFHMPLFFILSAVTFRPSENMEQFVAKTKKAFRHLIVPALIIFLLRSIIGYFSAHMGIGEYVKEKLLALLFASGVTVNIGETVISEFGMIWFFVALFLGRSLYDLLHLKLDKKILGIVTLVMSVAGVVVSRYIWLPLSFDIVMAIMPLFYVGGYIKTLDISKNTVKYLILSLIIWLATFGIVYYFGHGFLELAARSYPLYPLCIVCAIAGTLFVSYFSQAMSSLGFLFKPLTLIGANSIYLYCVHAMDYLYEGVWMVTGNVFVHGIVRVIIDLVIAGMIVVISSKVKSSKAVS